MRSRRVFWSASVLVALGASTSAVAEQPFELQTRLLAATGQPVPGEPSLEFGTVFWPTVNGSGDVAFAVELVDPAGDTPTRTAIIVERDGVRRLALRSGEAYPDGSGAVWGNLLSSIFSLSRDGELIVEGTLVDGDVPGEVTPFNSRVLASVTEHGVVSIVRSGAASPFGNGAFYDTFFGPFWSATETGELAVAAGLEPGTGDVTTDTDALLGVRAGSGLTQVIREGDVLTAPTGQEPVSLLGVASVNRHGEVAFFVEFDVPLPENQAIYRTAGGALASAVLSAEAAPPPLDGNEFVLLGEPVIDDRGEVVFRSIVSNMVDTNVIALHQTRGTRIDTLAFQGQAAPDGDPRPVGVASFWDVNPLGRAIFTVALGEPTNPQPRAIYSSATGVTHVVASAGGDAGGFPGAVFSSDVQSFLVPKFDPPINTFGDVAFQGELEIGVGGVTASDDAVLYLHDGMNRRNIPVLREGDMLEVDGETRQAAGVLINYLDPGTSAIGDRREVGYLVTFDDAAAGVYVTRLVTPCSPSDVARPLEVLDAFDAALFSASAPGESEVLTFARRLAEGCVAVLETPCGEADVAPRFTMLDAFDRAGFLSFEPSEQALDTFETAFAGGCD